MHHTSKYNTTNLGKKRKKQTNENNKIDDFTHRIMKTKGVAFGTNMYIFVGK